MPTLCFVTKGVPKNQEEHVCASRAWVLLGWQLVPGAYAMIASPQVGQWDLLCMLCTYNQLKCRLCKQTGRRDTAAQGLPLASHLHQATQWQCSAVAAVYGGSVSLMPLRKQYQSPAVTRGFVEGAEKHQVLTSLDASSAIRACDNM